MEDMQQKHDQDMQQLQNKLDGLSNNVQKVTQEMQALQARSTHIVNGYRGSCMHSCHAYYRSKLFSSK
jgi:uncharacterized protein YukE